MGKGSRFDSPWAASWHTGDWGLFGSLVLAALLGFHPGPAAAGPGVPGASKSGPVPALWLAASPADANGNTAGTAALVREAASADVHYVADWVQSTRDNEVMPYVIIDKVDARVYVFDAEGRLQGTSSALVGMVPGDGSAPGIGNRALSSIGPDERTTPAGRFIASLGPSLNGQDILWVDYDTALALHRVGEGTPAERRAQRLESPVPGDKRITYGCINVPVPFYEKIVRPAFRESSGVVYILPEMSAARDMFKPGAKP